MSALRIGCSGWSYKDWRGPFYPPAVTAREQLAWYATRFDTAEINASFYRLPAEATVDGWAERAPAGFLFAWKVSRFITHNKKLRDCADPVALVFGRMARLGRAGGPALVQLPPQLRRDDDRLAAFLGLLPNGRHAVEFRHDSWYAPQVFRILADFDAALCISDHHAAPSPWEVTASWVYLRGHGPGGRYVGRYPKAELARWAEAVAGWRAAGRDVYAYFDNDVKSAAPRDALALKALIDQRD
ncbi:DUF72 domain-containing protein [Phenylobacterium sp. LjRoot219]|uniref:DUF72 domain-containing protein n=1 Tax=Phenylobacterium sp. LjRoot219 TaxID=3342283 RepID=UPI003ECD0286